MSRGAKAAASRLGSLAERLVQGSGEPLGLAGLRERVAGVSTVMVTTIDEQGTLSSRPITVQEIDDSGDVWFVVDRHADWVHDGVDAERLRRLWNPVLDAWFPDGPPTDGVVVMHVQADRWEYWTAPSDPPGRPSAGSRARAPSYDADESGRAAMPGEGGEWMAGLCEGRVAIVTGAGRGIGREHALSLARQGAKVVDDPTAIGSVVEQLLADARPNSGMSGVPGEWPQTMLQS